MTWIRKTRLAATYGGGGIVGVSAGMVGLLAAQAKLARRDIGTLDDPVLSVDGLWLPGGGFLPGVNADRAPADALHIAVLGDSLSTGLGVDAAEEAPGGLIASAVATVTDHPVLVRSGAFVGAQTADLDGQIDAIGNGPFDVAVMMVGANDVTHRVLPTASSQHLAAALERLSLRGIPAVLGTCPDLGTVRPIPHPLRFLCRQWSRSLAARQAVVVEAWGGLAVSLADQLGPEFTAHPHEMFGADRFHPSTTGYATAAAALTPAVLDRLGVLRLNGTPAGAAS
jgi:lysophospholipase L1-like esterase